VGEAAPHNAAHILSAPVADDTLSQSFWCVTIVVRLAVGRLCRSASRCLANEEIFGNFAENAGSSWFAFLWRSAR
jgi:hypothetical protein